MVNVEVVVVEFGALFKRFPRRCGCCGTFGCILIRVAAVELCDKDAVVHTIVWLCNGCAWFWTWFGSLWSTSRGVVIRDVVSLWYRLMLLVI